MKPLDASPPDTPLRTRVAKDDPATMKNLCSLMDKAAHRTGGAVAGGTEVARKLKSSGHQPPGIFYTAAAGAYLCSREGRMLSCNAAYAKMLGYRNPAELLCAIRSVGEQLYVQNEGYPSLLTRLSEGEIIQDLESQVYGKDGDILWVTEHFAPHCDESGEMTNYEVVVTDISDRKQAEIDRNIAYSLMQTTMDSIAEYVAVVDLEGCLIFANRAFERDLGAVAGKERRLPFLPGQGCPFRRFLSLVTSNQNMDDSFQIRGYCSIDGCPGTLHAGITPFRSPLGEILGAVLVMHAASEK